MRQDGLLEELKGIGALRLDEPMARHTTFGVGGPADLYLKIDSRQSLREAAGWARRHGLPYFVLGSGSNILVGDHGFRGLVIENGARDLSQPVPGPSDSVHFCADSGLSFASLARRLCRGGYWGLEWAVGIPGTLGGAVVYNAGAYGGCLADVLVSVDVLDGDGVVERLPAEALGLEYRGSTFTRGVFCERVILSVELCLRRGEAAEIMQRVSELDTKRKAAQPPGRNAGSIFKNPEAKPAWWYIDQVGLRGARVGDAEISMKHANFFMNVDRARASDVKALMDEAVRRVREQFRIELHPEVGLVGEGFDYAGVAP
jgi:UDP-N-acetylmuramate dehydrogenase